MLRAILGALVKSVRRDFTGFGSLKTNNFFLFVALIIDGALVSGIAPISAYPFLLVLAVLMLVPMMGSLLNKIPRVRLGLWPLTPLWRAVLSVWRRRFVGAGRRARIGGGGLIANNLRQMLTVLDTYLALFIGAAGGFWRLLSQHPDPAAFPILSLLAALALSTYAQCLFALDGESGMTRYRLLPLPGWRIVLAKDAAFLALLLVAVLPLSIAQGLAFGLTALALGRYSSMHVRTPIERWRFTSGRVLWGVLQMIAGATLGFAAAVPIAVALYLLSLWWAGRQWDQR